MTCPLEKQLVALLDAAEIAFTRPERDKHDPTNLDFYLPEMALYIEVKQFHTPRIADQLAKVPHGSNAMVLVGPSAVVAFARLCREIVKEPIA